MTGLLVAGALLCAASGAGETREERRRDGRPTGEHERLGHRAFERGLRGQLRALERFTMERHRVLERERRRRECQVLFPLERPAEPRIVQKERPLHERPGRRFGYPEGACIDALEIDIERYQGEFVDGIADVVIGVPIDDLKVSKVAGSSLTSGGFNDAVQQIKDEARA